LTTAQDPVREESSPESDVVSKPPIEERKPGAPEPKEPEPPPSPLKEITQPFVDLVHAPRVLWGINLPNMLEGFCYFGLLTWLAMFFNQFVGLNDMHADWMVSVLTGGITLSMLFFGGFADKWGVRRALVISFALMLVGRIIISAAPFVFPIILNYKDLLAAFADKVPLPTHGSPGAFSNIFWACAAGMLFVIAGYGLYQPAAYAAVRKYTDSKTAAMGYAMLYALMNLGGFLPGLASPPVRAKAGVPGVFWMYTATTVVSLIVTAVLITRRAEETALASLEAPETKDEGDKKQEAPEAGGRRKGQIKLNGLVIAFGVAGIGLGVFGGWLLARHHAIAAGSGLGVGLLAGAGVLGALLLSGVAMLLQRFDHPLADPKFTFFIFALIPVQTLFAHNWLTLPQYVFRAMGEVGRDYMEFFVNLNPILIFVLTPTVAALTRKRNVYHMMIAGTFIMASPTFLLAIKPSIALLLVFLVVMSVGEAMWQPRFLQYAAEIAPEGRTGAYMGVAQFPWFLTKVITGLYAGWFLMKFCPENGARNTELMWLIYGLIAMTSSVILLVAKGWLAKDFKTKAA